MLFKAPDGEDDPPVDVIHKGRLSKKSPKSTPLAVMWQTRWFELQPSHLAYWELSKIEGAVKKGHLALSDMVGVRAHQRDPRRFDLLLKSKRLFELKAESHAERDEWTRVMQDALLRNATASVGDSAAEQSEPRGARIAVDNLSMISMTTRTEEEAEAEQAAEQAIEDDDDGADESVDLSTSMRTLSLRSQNVRSAGPATAGNIAAAPVVVQAAYASRVQRAKLANAAARRHAPP